jgi:hypothetical protein
VGENGLAKGEILLCPIGPVYVDRDICDFVKGTNLLINWHQIRLDQSHYLEALIVLRGIVVRSNMPNDAYLARSTGIVRSTMSDNNGAEGVRSCLAASAAAEWATTGPGLSSG